MTTTRPASWIKAAEGGKADIAKPLHGFGSAVMEIALAYSGDAFRVVYAVQLEDEIWLITAFRKSRSKASRRPNTKSIW